MPGHGQDKHHIECSNKTMKQAAQICTSRAEKAADITNTETTSLMPD